MAQLFNIERFSFSTTGKTICIETDKGHYFINKAKFEKWVDDREKRKCECGLTCCGLIDWDYYYQEYGEVDLYDYLIIRAGSSILEDIKKGIDNCLN